MNNKSLVVVNFLGGPGTRKSTTALALASIMKQHGMRVEYVHEFAKDLVYDQRGDMFTEQEYILGQQNLRQRRLVKSGVPWCVTDTSILLGIFYRPREFYDGEAFDNFVMSVYASYTNINIRMERVGEYVSEDRNQSLEEAMQVDERVCGLLTQHRIPYATYRGTENVAQQIFNEQIVPAYNAHGGE